MGIRKPYGVSKPSLKPWKRESWNQSSATRPKEYKMLLLKTFSENTRKRVSVGGPDKTVLTLPALLARKLIKEHHH
jgi:hypothetical protein